MIRSLRTLTTGDNPLTLSAGKELLGVSHDDDDDEILRHISAAFEDFEIRTGRVYRTTAGTLYASQFPGGAEPIVVPIPPLQSVTAITYTDTSGNIQTLDPETFDVITSAVPGEIIPVSGTVWPVALDRRGSVVVTFVAGNAATCPSTILKAAALSIDHEYHEHSETQSARIQQRIEDVVRRHCLRDSRLVGIGR